MPPIYIPRASPFCSVLLCHTGRLASRVRLPLTEYGVMGGRRRLQRRGRRRGCWRCRHGRRQGLMAVSATLGPYRPIRQRCPARRTGQHYVWSRRSRVGLGGCRGGGDELRIATTWGACSLIGRRDGWAGLVARSGRGQYCSRYGGSGKRSSVSRWPRGRKHDKR